MDTKTTVYVATITPALDEDPAIIKTVAASTFNALMDKLRNEFLNRRRPFEPDPIKNTSALLADGIEVKLYDV